MEDGERIHVVQQWSDDDIVIHLRSEYQIQNIIYENRLFQIIIIYHFLKSFFTAALGINSNSEATQSIICLSACPTRLDLVLPASLNLVQLHSTIREINNFEIWKTL